jgi:hypothetical protein
MRGFPLFLAILALTACGGRSENDAILETFSGYKQAILNKDGAAAVQHVPRETIDYYQQMVDWSLTADRDSLESLSTINKLGVLLMRQRIPADKLRMLDGKEAFIYAVDNGWIGERSTIATEIGDIQISGDRATAAVYINAQKAPLRYHFAKENGSWTFNLLKAMTAGDQGLKMAIRKAGMPENEFLLSLLESVSGRKVPDSIWEPLEKTDPATRAVTSETESPSIEQPDIEVDQPEQ